MFPVLAQTRLSADEIEKLVINGQDVRIYRNNFILDQAERTLTCTQATEYLSEKRFVCIGNVVITNKEDGSTITGDSLYYNQETKQAIMMGNVVSVNKESTLRTQTLYYDADTKKARYTTGGTLTDSKSTLTSTYGEIDQQANMAYFRDKVVLQSEKGSLNTDTLDYNTSSKVAFFRGPSKVISKDGNVISRKGQYDTKTELVKLEERSTVETDEYYFTGDVLDYDRAAMKGYAKGKVVLVSKKDTIRLTGDEAYFNDNQGISKVWGNAIMRRPFGIKDSLLLRADTLLSIGGSKTPKLKRKLKAWYKVQIWKDDIQAKCDSLVYDASDSTMQFYTRPVIWSRENQVTGDTIIGFMANNKLNRLKSINNAFLVNQDTLGNYNQLRGRLMTAIFNDSSNIKKVLLDGNGQSLFHALDGDTVVTGLNRVDCSNMIVYFKPKNKLHRINFIYQPEGRFIPPHELTPEDRKLKGFVWRGKERPTRNSVLGLAETVRITANPAKETAIQPKKPKPKLLKKSKKKL